MIRTLMRGLMLLALASAPVLAATPGQQQFDALVAQVKAEMLTDPPAAARRAAAGEQLAAKIGDRRARGIAEATVAWLQGEAWYRVGDLDRAGPLIENALRQVQATAPGIKLEADALLTSGNLRAMRAEVAPALIDLQRAYRIFMNVGDGRGQAKSLICIALLYVDAKDYGSALRYFGEALDAYPADPGLALAIYNGRGVVYQEQGQHARASVEFQQALTAAREMKSGDVQVKFLRNIARNQLFAGQVAQAERSIAAARALSQNGSDHDAQLDAVEAQAALQHGRLSRAGQLIDRAFSRADLSATELPLRDAHRTAVAVYQAQNRPDRALAHLQALKRLDDQATTLATQTSTALMAARFNSANQDAKIARLRDAERLRQAREEVERARTERTLWLGGAGATATIIILLLIGMQAIRRSRDQVRAANADLAVTNTALGKALAAKTEFLATTSHEIRTPLNGILGMTQVMLADQALAPATRDRLTVVHSAGVAMRGLVDDILDVAKMETGHLEIERTPFELRAMLEDAARMWADQAREKGLTFTVALDRCPARVEGDAARVRQIVFNLLSNALKFTAQGSVTLSAESTDQGVRIVVADTGIGIADDQRDAVFESFRQADASTTRRFGGTGLGLSICRSLARAMGGDVALASEQGKGSSFYVHLPLPLLETLPSGDAEPADGETMLVVDRNPIARAMLRTLLSPHIAALTFAGTAEEAEAALAGKAIGRVIVDDATAKGSGDGHAFVKKLVDSAGGAAVILLWAAATDEEAELMALGVTGIVAKPVSGSDLVNRLFRKDTTIAQQSSLVSEAA